LLGLAAAATLSAPATAAEASQNAAHPAPPLLRQVAVSPSQAGVTPAQPPPVSEGKPLEGVTVYGRAYRDKLINDFVASYAQPPQTEIGQLARWRVGICPGTTGLQPDWNLFVTNRVKEVAAQVGAPVDTKKPCLGNVLIVFTRQPQKLVDSMRAKSARFLGSHYPDQEKELATVRYPIQAWYQTATADYNGRLSVDDIADTSAKCTMQIPPQLCGRSASGPYCTFEYHSCPAAKASRLGVGFRSEFLTVTIVIDSNKILGYPLGALADDIAMMALAQTKSFDGCRELVSITNLTSPGCEASRKANALTVNDLAYLRGLYQMNIELGADVQRTELGNRMRTNLDRPNR
jgi:hypothetical protein